MKRGIPTLSCLIFRLRSANVVLLVSPPYLVDVITVEALQNRLRILEGGARGERAIQKGRTSTHAQAKRRRKYR